MVRRHHQRPVLVATGMVNHGVERTTVWLGHTPTGDDLEGMPLEWFHQAVDQLERETVPKSYYDKVVAKRQAEAWDVR
jgi:hypothetical protein